MSRIPLLSSLFSLALVCVPQASPAERVVDLTAADGTTLKATWFPAARPGPGVLLLHQCNRQRKVGDGLAIELLPADTTDPEARRNGIRESAEQKLKQLAEKQP
jgi:hypothetical protein